MPDEMMRRGTLSVPIATVLIGAVLASAPGAAADPDRRLIDAVRTQDASQVRALLSRGVDVNATVGRRLDGAAVGRALERRRRGRAARSRRRRRERRQRFRHDAALARLHQRQRARWSSCCSKAGAKPDTADRHRRDAAHDVRRAAAAPPP